MSTTLHHIANLLEHDQCIGVNRQTISSIRAGTYTKNKLENVVTMMKTHGCGVSHASNIDPNRSSRLKTLPAKQFKVFKIDATHDNIFHAFLQGVSFIVNHHQVPHQKITESTKQLRRAIVESILKDKTLQNAMTRNGTIGYQNQFIDAGKRSFAVYSRKMRANAYASYTELAALSMYADMEIHIYDRAASGFTYLMRYKPKVTTAKSKKYLIRLVRSQRGRRDHFDLLIPAAFHNHQAAGFWNHVNQHIFGQRRTHTRNSPEKALELLKASNENNKTENPRNYNNLPNENKRTSNRNFSWNDSPALKR